MRTLLATLIAVAIVAAKAATAIAACTVATFVILAFWRPRRAVAVGLAAGLLVVGSVLAIPSLRGKVHAFAASVRHGDYDSALRGRVLPFTVALNIASDYPLTGSGPGTFGWNYFPYAIEALALNPSLTDSVAGQAGQSNFEEVHNDHLQVLSEFGMPGSVLLLVAIISLIRRGFPASVGASELSEREQFSRLALPALAAGFAVLALAQYPLQLASSLSSMVFVAGIGLAWSNVGRTPIDGIDAPGPCATLSPPSLVGRTALLLLGAGTSFLVYQSVVPKWTCNNISKVGETALHMSREGDPAARDYLERLLPVVRHCQSELPLDANLYIVDATTCSQLGRHEEALEVYNRALSVDRRPEFYFNRAVEHLQLGNPPAALEDYVLAARLSPKTLKRIRNPQLRDWVEARVQEYQIVPEQ